MIVDFKPFFKKYEALVDIAEKGFERIRSGYPDCVKCKIECSDCCHAVFDMPLIEALYIHHKFKETLDEKRQARLIEKANKADRELHMIKRSAYKAAAGGRNESEILTDMAEKRVRCPLLNSREKCELYSYRPITCRLYGVPTAIKGVGRTCGLSDFKPGKAYPTIHIDIFYRKLYELSKKMVHSIHSRHIKMADMLIPVSMALLTDFNDAYIGIGDEKRNADKGAIENEHANS
jgi:Fe-S-cluster containining protein